MSRKMRKDNKNKRQARKRWKEERKKHIEGDHRLQIYKRSKIKSNIYSHEFAVCMATRMIFFLGYQIDGRITVRVDVFLSPLCINANVIALAVRFLAPLYRCDLQCNVFLLNQKTAHQLISCLLTF